MMTKLLAWLKRLCVAVGLFIARLGGWTPCALPHLPADEMVDQARVIVRDIETRFPQMPGTLKAREALRCLLNLHPNTAMRDLNLLIELALQ
jgi:hypothetical protein